MPCLNWAAEAGEAPASSPSRGISSTFSTPFLPTTDGMLRARLWRPYSPSRATETGSTACSSLTMHSAMRATAMAMP